MRGGYLKERNFLFVKKVRGRRFLVPLAKTIFSNNIIIGDHSFKTYAKFSEKLTFLTP